MTHSSPLEVAPPSSRVTNAPRGSHRLLAVALAATLALAGAASGSAQPLPLPDDALDWIGSAETYPNCFTLGSDGCPVQKLNCPLVQPPTISAVDGVLDTSLTVLSRTASCVPLIGANANPTAVQWATMQLRNYASPANPGGAVVGPTWRVRKAVLANPGQVFDPVTNPVATPGDRLRVLLRNSLPNDPGVPLDGCRPVVFPVCSDNPTQLCSCNAPNGVCNATDPDAFDCDVNDTSRTCRLAQVAEVAPNCIHGVEVTNLHFHGSHFSPQPHGDYVLLSLYSENQTSPPPPNPGEDPSIAIGSYQYDIPQVPWNQAPGTHWYHPHKHGSTSVQLINGLSGALVVTGELDDYLHSRYGVNPNRPAQLKRFEKVMVVQQIFPDVAFFQNGKKPPGYPPYPLVNGQLVPTIRMRFGEVQRWRFVSATSNPATQGQVKLDLDPAAFPGFEVAQIAQDGIQFHPTNYQRQPLGNATDGYELAPGNRVDLLVRAPDAPADGKAMVFYVMRRVTGDVPEDERAAIAAQNRLVNEAAGLRSATAEDLAASGALVRVYVSGVQSPTMDLPTDWPAMPPYLADLSTTTAADRFVSFSMATDDAGGSRLGSPGAKFFIDGMQYSDSCAGQTLELGQAQRWRIFNNSVSEHPFHIHINPFQLTWRRWNVDPAGNKITAVVQEFEPPYPWFDTISLKAGLLNRISETRILYRADDYTGATVLHCHFLAHEDRGMMTNVQLVCPTAGGIGTSPIQFGTPRADGSADDCTTAPAHVSPLLFCPASDVGDDDGGHGH
jgi:FtsP/CotA-like multicopper oxidase with cupredoxin domain